SILMTNKNTSNDKLGALDIKYYRFLNTNYLGYLHGTGLILRNFPSLEIDKNIDLVIDYGIYPANNAKYSLCNEKLNFITGEKIPDGGTQDYRFWLISANIGNNSIEKNYKNLFTTKSMYAIYLIDNCTKIIVGK